ncbi:hypothetical protein BG003_000745, partial [Podila horticola]
YPPSNSPSGQEPQEQKEQCRMRIKWLQTVALKGFSVPLVLAVTDPCTVQFGVAPSVDHICLLEYSSCQGSHAD